MNTQRWNPFREFDQVFDRYVLPVPGAVARDAHHWQPLVDVRETEDAYRVEVELPAVNPKDVRIGLQDGVVNVSGERRAVASDDADRVHRTERRYGKFARSFRLPEDADADAIRATAKDGVITIVVGKSAKAGARAIEVEIA